MTAALPYALNSQLSEAQLTALAAELDALRDRVLADIGQRDADYIRNIHKAVRYTGKIGSQSIDLWWLERAQLPAG